MSKPLHLCPTKWCRRRKRKKGNLCPRCSLRLWRKANPVAARLAVLRDRAQRKHLAFDLTLPWLERFLRENAHDPSIHHIDRISAGRGYVMGNLQVLPIADNIAKGNRERWGQLQIL